ARARGADARDRPPRVARSRHGRERDDVRGCDAIRRDCDRSGAARRDSARSHSEATRSSTTGGGVLRVEHCSCDRVDGRERVCVPWPPCYVLYSYYPMAFMNVTADCFREMARRCRAAAPRLAAVLEGGYNLDTLPTLVDAALDGFTS